MGLVVTFILGAFVLAGAAIGAFAKNEELIREVSIAVALGAMAMLLIEDLVPEVVEEASVLGYPLIVVGISLGVAVLVVLDRFLPDHHHEADHNDSALHIGLATAIALIIHNIVEGMGVYSVSIESATLSVLLGIGIGIHNIPMGMIVSAGIRDQSTPQKIAVLAAASLSTFVGGLVMFTLSSAIDERIVLFMICLTIGMLGYIILFELVPHVVCSKNKPMALLCIVIGLAAVAASGLLEGLA
ncbi:Zinc transporter ZupT [Slackia heliotrinireducens]|uniref:Predicted divalent heavy-metal cations transporter n=1 Tax=Slackia heliotrinireducens (strain ATCC 29202 / DSM 20476 / NCTC 11029 / RHS 1) TaxID=471855 RepID=C7N7R4_SLAHD|nr:divalent heavy-metal cations transporter [Slackia heliotrinireducens]ACV22949.1 predicted divalent heavy-metal cations transporter [Slackia heliotrinireducens DSM 20476]VEH01791.1 Zinc transporter ZupT [Slackia heliotrinireducens]